LLLVAFMPLLPEVMKRRRLNPDTCMHISGTSYGRWSVSNRWSDANRNESNAMIKIDFFSIEKTHASSSSLYAWSFNTHLIILPDWRMLYTHSKIMNNEQCVNSWPTLLYKT
jgi:hypothetical protein